MTTTFTFVLLTALTAGGEWPHWRGPARDGISAESDWSPTGEPESRWTRQLGTGYSNVSIVSGRLFTSGYDEEAQQDVQWCLDPETGEELWVQRYDAAPLANFHGGGTLSTPTVDGDVVYTMNRFGLAFCRKVEDGQVLWEHDYKEELELTPTFHGFSASPLALNDQLILVLGGTVVSVGKADGAVRWQSANSGDGGYANPMPFELRGRECLAVFTGKALLVLDRSNGEELHRAAWAPEGGGVNAATPIVLGERIFISSAYDMGAAMIELGEGPEAGFVWKNPRFRSKVGDVVLWEGNFYGFDESMLKCVDLEGEEKWRVRGLGMGTLSLAGGRLLVLSSKGELIVAEATPEEFRELSRAKVLDTRGGVCWTAPVLLDGRIYCRSSLGELVCRDHSEGNAAVAAAAAAAGALPAALELFAGHVEAIGGEASLRSHSSYRAKGEIEILGAGITRSEMTLERMVPDRWHLTYETGYDPVHRGYDGEIGWQVDPFYGNELYEGAQLEEMQETLPFHLDLDYAKAYASMETVGLATFGDRPCWVVEVVSTQATKRRLYFDRESGLLAGREAETESMVVYADYADFGGVKLPRRTTVLIPETGAEETYFVSEVTFDEVEERAFDRPSEVLRLLRTPEEVEAENEIARKKYAAHLGAYVADFEPHGGAHFKVLVQDGDLALDVPGQQVYVLVPTDEEGHFLLAVSKAVSVDFVPDEEEGFASIKIVSPRGTNELARVADEPEERGE